MAKFLICFRVETVEEGSIEVEAESAKDAASAFKRGDYEPQRLAASLVVEDSEDSITEIQSIEHPERVWIDVDGSLVGP